MKIIGLSGTNGSGKDTIAQLLRDEYGWYFADATEMLGEELTKRGLPHERANKAMVSTEWRQQYGMGAVVDRGVERFRVAEGTYDGLVVSSVRHPGEADRVHELGGLIIWVDAKPEIRYRRITSVDRGRIEDKKTYQQFLAEQEAEMHGKVDDPAALKISAVKERADIRMDNDGDDIEKFRQDVVELLKAQNVIR